MTMIRKLGDFAKLAREKGPKKMVVLAPEDNDFMMAIKKSHELGYIEPILVGNKKRIAEAAQKVDFNIGSFREISEEDKQSISDLGIRMLFSGETPIAGKGQIPTSYIYRSIIREEAKANSGMTVSVVSLWEVPGIDHLIAFTDTGVSIKPNMKAKKEIIQNAVFVFHLLGYTRPKIAVLSGQREVGGTMASYRDYEALKIEADEGKFGDCEIVPATSFTEIFLAGKKRTGDEKNVRKDCVPHILIVPCLDTGNIICKLDFFLNVKRSSLVATSRGPVCIPSRSDKSHNLVEQISMGVVLADHMERKKKVQK